MGSAISIELSDQVFEFDSSQRENEKKCSVCYENFGSIYLKNAETKLDFLCRSCSSKKKPITFQIYQNPVFTTNKNYLKNSINVAILGDSDSGKTALVRAIRKEPFNPNYIPTIAADFFEYKFTNLVCIKLWDTSGSEQDRNLIKTCLNKANLVIICQDINQENQLIRESILKWTKFAKFYSCQKCHYIIAITKVDIYLDEISSEELGNFMKNTDSHISYYFTSSKESRNIDIMIYDYLNRKEFQSV